LRLIPVLSFPFLGPSRYRRGEGQIKRTNARFRTELDALNWNIVEPQE